MLLLRVSAGGDSLLTTQRFDVDAGVARLQGTHRETFTLGLDTLAESDPPVWLDILAYAVATAILGLLLGGLSRSLGRLAMIQSSAAHG